MKRTKEMFLVYGGDQELIVKGYVDASFDTDSDDSKSQTGYVLKVGSISYMLLRITKTTQGLVALST